MGRLLSLLLYAIGMAYVEAMVVVYLRRLVPLAVWEHAGSYAQLTQLIRQSHIMLSEQTREFATIVMLVTVAYLFGKSFRERLAGFLVAFGTWDIFYYIFLFVWLRWPARLSSPDVLFLIPVPWVAPVWLPVVISCLLTICGGILLVRPHGKSVLDR